MNSPTYQRFREAMIRRKQVVCTYNGKRRRVFPIILGHKDGKEAALTFQVGGESQSGLPRRGEWRCLYLEKASDIELRDEPWRSGTEHGHAQACVDVVDLDVNPNSPYRPKRSIVPKR